MVHSAQRISMLNFQNAQSLCAELKTEKQRKGKYNDEEPTLDRTNMRFYHLKMGLI